VNTYLATTEPQGAVSWLNYAFRLMYLPIGLFGVSIATAAIPDIARHAAASDRPAMRGTVAQALRLMLMLNVPATAALIVLAHPIVELLLERGRFTPQDTAATAAALIFYAPGLVGYSAVKIISPTFYSLGDSRTPVVASVLSVALNLAVNLALVRALGHRGLALGTALAAMFNAAVLLWLLGRRIDGLDGRRTAFAFLKILVASAVMAAGAWATSQALLTPLPSAVLVRGHVDLYLCARLGLSIAAGVLLLGLSARLLRIAEFDEALRRVASRLRGHTRGAAD
jgi:putative peptidoglycan lipid II flippase